jgi:hypothetical protein
MTDRSPDATMIPHFAKTGEQRARTLFKDFKQFSKAFQDSREGAGLHKACVVARSMKPEQNQREFQDA